jgi:hypothetical protein
MIYLDSIPSFCGSIQFLSVEREIRMAEVDVHFVDVNLKHQVLPAVVRIDGDFIQNNL